MEASAGEIGHAFYMERAEAPFDHPTIRSFAPNVGMLPLFN